MTEAPIPTRDLAARIAAFEFRLQTRSPVFLIVVGIGALMVVGSLTVERLQVGPLRTGNRTSAESVLMVHLVWSLFFLFTAAAFAVTAALRDETARFGEIVRSTPASAHALAGGRFGGALAAVLLSFLGVPVALLLAPFAPWAGPLAPPDLSAIAYGLLVLAVPNLVLVTGVFFALARVVRSAMAAYLGAVALLVLYGLGSGSAGPLTFMLALLDPFGFAAIRFATAGWSAGERAASLPPLGGALALNRLVWLGVAGIVILFALLHRPGARQGRRRPAPPRAAAPSPRMITVAPRFDRQTLAAQFAARTRLELGRALRGPFLPVLLLLGLANTFGTLASVPPDAPLAATMARVDDAFRLVPIVVATFWAGELVWGEHDLGLDQIVGASPVPGAALILPKIATLLLILAGSLGTVSLVAAGLEGWRAAAWHIGTWPIGSWLAGFALPRAWDAGLLAILAVFLQAVSPGKLAGFGLMILYLISALALETMGFHGDLYRYGGASTSLALGEATSPHALLVRAYWSAAALLLTMLSCRLAGRGVAEPFGRRLIRVRRSSGGEILGLVAAAALTLVLGILLSLGAHLGP